MYGHGLITNRLYICRSRMTHNDKKTIETKICKKVRIQWQGGVDK
jgi:hypothetical protein